MTTCETCLALVVLNTPTGEPRAAVTMTAAELAEAACAVTTPELAQRLIIGLALLDEDAARIVAEDRGGRLEQVNVEPTRCWCPCGCCCHSDASACPMLENGLCTDCSDGRHEIPPSDIYPSRELLLKQYRSIAAQFEQLLASSPRVP